MKRARLVFVIFALVTTASAAAAQDREYIRLLEKLLVGASGAINAEITDLRRQLARCDGPANQRLPTDNCATRTLIQAQLNYLLRIGMAFGDPDTAGTRVVASPPRPPDLTNFRNLRAALFEKVSAEPTRDITYVISEDRAKLAIVYHCAAMLDFDANGLTASMTSEEIMAVRATGKINTDVNACIREYDAKEVSANRKAAIEYCFQSNNYVTDPSMQALFDTCMLTHDMIQAMCKQEFEQATNYGMRKQPGTERPIPVECFKRQARPNPGEVQAILSASAAGTMAELPPKFLAVPPAPPPHPSYPTPVPPVPIPTGTVLDTTLIGQVYPVFVEGGLGQGVIVQARLDRPLVIGGQTALPARPISLKARIIGPGTRPNSVLIGFTTYFAYWGRTKEGQNAGYDLKSDELVFTVAKRGSAPGLSSFVSLDTKLRFTIGSTAGAAAPVPGTSPATPPAQRAPVPPAAAAPPPAAAPPASGPADRQQQAEERRKQAERQIACVQQVTKAHPQGGLALAQAIAACTGAK